MLTFFPIPRFLVVFFRLTACDLEIWWNLYEVVAVGAWGAHEALLVRDREWKIKRKRNVLHWHWQKLSLWVCDKQKKRSTTTICLSNAPRCLYFPPHLIWPQKKVSRSPDIDNGRTMSMFCRPVNYSSFYQLVYLLSSFMSHTRTYHQENKALAPLLFEFELQIISNLLLPPQTKTSGQTMPFLFLPASTAHACRAWIISDHSKHCPSEHFYSFGSFCIFFFLIFCLQSTRVCVWLARAGSGTQDWFSLNISTNQGPRTLRRPVGKCRSAFDWWHATIFFRLRAHSSLPAGGRWPSFRPCDTRLCPLDDTHLLDFQHTQQK